MKFTILAIRICVLLAASLVLAVSGTRAQELSQTHFYTSNALERMKTDVYRRGVGEKSKVVIKMKDGTSRKGFIRQTADDSFDLTSSQTGKTTAIAYRDVVEVKKPGRSPVVRAAVRFARAVAVTTIVLAATIAKGGSE